MQQFFRQDLLLQGDKQFEFVTRGYNPRSHLIPQNLPRKYTYGDDPSWMDRFILI